MTSPAIKLAKECFGEGSHPIITVENAERFYAKAQAQALRDAAERIAEIFERDYANSYLRGDEVARIIRGRMK